MNEMQIIFCIKSGKSYFCKTSPIISIKVFWKHESTCRFCDWFSSKFFCMNWAITMTPNIFYFLRCNRRKFTTNRAINKLREKRMQDSTPWIKLTEDSTVQLELNHFAQIRKYIACMLYFKVQVCRGSLLHQFYVKIWYRKTTFNFRKCQN